MKTIMECLLIASVFGGLGTLAAWEMDEQIINNQSHVERMLLIMEG